MPVRQAGDIVETSRGLNPLILLTYIPLLAAKSDPKVKYIHELKGRTKTALVH
jgi:hypothetical protein